MDKVKNVAKSGWHPPGKDGGKESWRGDNKGINQVVSQPSHSSCSPPCLINTDFQAGWIGRGKDPHAAAKDHQSRPLATLKNPDAFGPPPKNLNYHGGAAVPNAITPDRRGLGAPVSTEEIQAKEAEGRRQQEEAARKQAAPPVPYRVNTTGLDTRNLPKPPVRRLDHEDEGQTPSPMSARPKPKPKPSLPPRLPPRQNSHPNLHAPDPPPTYTAATQQQLPTQKDEYNVGALSRLGKAGVSVPGFGIGSKPQDSNTESQPPNPWASQPSTTPTSTSPPPPAPNSSISGLQSHFSKLSTTSPPPSSTQGTSMQQKQDALRTASAFHKDPSSVSLADAKATASTANNFRERHGEQVVAGGRWAGAMNKKYDVANKISGYSEGGTSSVDSQGQATLAQEPSPWADEPSAGMGATSPIRENPPTASSGTPLGGGFKKAPPPPPPPHSRSTAPPPVPLGSKPKG